MALKVNEKKILLLALRHALGNPTQFGVYQGELYMVNISAWDSQPGNLFGHVMRFLLDDREWTSFCGLDLEEQTEMVTAVLGITEADIVSICSAADSIGIRTGWLALKEVWGCAELDIN
jgi:hypothetical protein